MSRPIDADALIEEIAKIPDLRTLSTKTIGEAIGRMPTVEPERKTGRWEITDAYPHNVYCSECHKKFAQTHWAVWEDGSLPRGFCPNCGAKMEAEG